MAMQTTRRPNRTDSAARWQSAAQRAIAGGVQVRQLAGSGQWIATSGADSSTAYTLEVTGAVAHGCDCLASLNGDPVCRHRAAWYVLIGALSGDPEPEPPAPVTCPSATAAASFMIPSPSNTADGIPGATSAPAVARLPPSVHQGAGVVPAPVRHHQEGTRMASRNYELVLSVFVDLNDYSGGEAALPAGLESGSIAIEAGSADGRTWWRVKEERPDERDNGPTLIDLEDVADPLARFLAFLGFPACD